jgi:nicotinamide riboside kinase
VRTEAEERARAATLFLLCDTDVPFEPDPQRSFPDAAGRERCRRLWRETLVQRKLPFADVRGTWAQREAAAIAAVKKLLG